MTSNSDHIIDDCEEFIRQRNPNNQDESVETFPRGTSDGVSVQSMSSCAPDVAPVSQFSALLLTVNVTIGAGLLTIPASLQDSGIIPGLAIQGFILILIIGSCIMLTLLTATSGANSYHALLDTYGNKTLFNICNTFVLLLTFGTAVAFPVIIGDQFDRIFSTLYGSEFCHTWYLSREFTMTFSTLILIGPFCYSKSIGFLKYASLLGIVSIGFISYVVIDKYSVHTTPRIPVNYYPNNWTDSFSIVPCLCFAYQCHLSWVPTAAALPRRDKIKSSITVTLAVIISAIVYTVISTAALLTFGGSIEDDFMENFSDKTPFVISAILILAIKCILTYPLAIFPARISTNDALCSAWPTFAALSERWRITIISTMWVVFSWLLALFVPGILIAIDILGSLSAIFVFIFPAVAWIKYVRRLKDEDTTPVLGEVPRKQGPLTASQIIQIAICVFYIIFGIVVFCVILKTSIDKVLHPKTGNRIVCH